MSAVPSARLARLMPFALALSLAAAPVPAQPPDPKPPTDDQKLQELQRLSGEVTKAETAGKWDEAAAAAEKLLAFTRKSCGEKGEATEAALGRLATIQERREDFAAARACRQEVVAIRAGLSGKDHWQSADARRELVHIELLSKLSAQQRERLTEARRLNLEVLRLLSAAKSAEALPLANRALDIRKELLGEAHPDCALLLNNLARLYQAQGDYARAEPLLRQATETYKHALGEAHPAYADCLNHLALLCAAQGDYAHAEPLLRDATEIYKKALGAEHSDYAAGLNNLALLYRAQGEHARAESLFRKATELWRKALGEAHPNYASGLNNLALLYQDQADHARAEPLLRQALEIRRKALGEAHPDYAWSLDNLATLYRAQGDHGRAEPLCCQALEIRRKVLDEAHPDYAASLNNLAVLYQDQGDYARAEPLYLQATEIKKKALGEAHPDYALGLNNLAVLYQAQGDRARAEPLFRQAAETYKRALGEAHPDYARSLNNLGLLQMAHGDNARARPLIRQSLVRTRDHLDATALIQSERRQLRMTQQLLSRLDSFLSVALDAETPPGQVAPFLLQAKGAVFVRQRRQRQLLDLAGRDSEAARVAAELDRTARRLATLAGRTPQPGQLAAWQQDLADLTEQKERLEADLSRLSADFRAQKARERLTPEQLRDRLPADVALVDLHEYTHYTPDLKGKGRFLYERRLLALVLRKGRPVALVPLGPVQPVADAVEKWRLTLKRTQSARDDDPALVLRKFLWLPLAAHLEGAKTVLISPDGATGRVPFAALPGSKPGTYLIEEVQIAVVPVPQLLPELLDRKPEAEEGRPSLLLVGGVDFGADPGRAADLIANRTAADRAGRRHQWGALPGTDKETDALRALFARRFPDAAVTTLRGPEASEAAVREQAPRHRWLHLATHGFFAPAEVKSVTRREDDHDVLSRAIDPLGERGVTGWHPGLLSGLVLAGANRAPEADKDDGILTALEVQALDLRHVELAVLSACETGLGESAGGEGVLGLQRSFQAAGVRSVVTTLWTIPDAATQVLMERFYANRWDRGMAPLKALQEAQVWMLREGKTQPGVARGLVRDDAPQPLEDGRLPPYYWAAFVLSGDWR